MSDNEKLKIIEKQKKDIRDKYETLQINFEKEKKEIKDKLKELSKDEKKIKDKIIHKEKRVFCEICQKNVDKYAYDKHLNSQKHKLKLFEKNENI
jgi:hypothetical protein